MICKIFTAPIRSFPSKDIIMHLDQCLWNCDWIKVKLSSTYGCVLAILMRLMALSNPWDCLCRFVVVTLYRTFVAWVNFQSVYLQLIIVHKFYRHPHTHRKSSLCFLVIWGHYKKISVLILLSPKIKCLHNARKNEKMSRSESFLPWLLPLPPNAWPSVTSKPTQSPLQMSQTKLISVTAIGL